MTKYVPKTEDYEEFSQVSLARGVIRLFLQKLNEYEKMHFQIIPPECDMAEYGKGVLDGYNQQTMLIMRLLDEASAANGLGHIRGHEETIKIIQWNLEE